MSLQPLQMSQQHPEALCFYLASSQERCGYRCGMSLPEGRRVPGVGGLVQKSPTPAGSSETRSLLENNYQALLVPDLIRQS